MKWKLFTSNGILQSILSIKHPEGSSYFSNVIFLSTDSSLPPNYACDVNEKLRHTQFSGHVSVCAFSHLSIVSSISKPNVLPACTSILRFTFRMYNYSQQTANPKHLNELMTPCIYLSFIVRLFVSQLR